MVTKKPKVGTMVELKTINTSAALHGPFAATTPRFNILRGMVAELPEWERDPQMVCIVIAGDEIPLRLVHMSRILSINGIDYKHQSPDQDIERKVFHVQGSKGANYVVTNIGKNWSCSCPGFSFRKICKHILALDTNN